MAHPLLKRLKHLSPVYELDFIQKGNTPQGGLNLN